MVADFKCHMQGTNLGAQMPDYRCFYSDPPHQLSQMRDIPAPFHGLRGHNILFDVIVV